MLALALASGNGDGGKTHVAHVAVSDGPEQLDAVLEEMTFARLEQVVQFRAVSAWFGVLSKRESVLLAHSPTIKLTFGKAAHMRGAVATRRSMPLRYAKREMTTMLTVLGRARYLREWRADSLVSSGCG